MHWFVDPIKHQYADFKGRTSRRAYWMFVLVSFLVYLAVSIVAAVAQLDILVLLLSLALAVPHIAIGARRLHDTGMSGWWQLIGLIPFLGGIALIVLLARASEPQDNKYGPDLRTAGVPSDMDPSPVPPVVESPVAPTAEKPAVDQTEEPSQQQ